MLSGDGGLGLGCLGVWEREIRAVKTALRVILGKQTTSKAVLQTVLIEVEGIMNSKPLGYLSSNAADPDPVTPNLLLMGRRDASLPQAMFANSKLLGRRKWCHSQMLADHFWTWFIHDYLPTTQRKMAERSPESGSREDCSDL